MYKITWDKETGGVLLNSRVMPGTLGVSPRPVFWEELDLLKLNELGWLYPHCDEPLLWACNKQYFYRGEMVFEAKGANLYDNATILFQSNAENLTLEPIDVKMMLHKNKDEMFLVESEAIEFIRDTYTMYASAKKNVDNIDANKIDFEEIVKQQEKRTKQKMAIVKEDCDSFDIMPLDKAQKQGKRNYLTTKIDKFLASFSGGKDSQVVLDLCTRAIPSTAFEVIYSDTGYELPPSLELYKSVQEHYKKRFPDLKFSLTKNHESVLNYWDKIGTPSDTHRWCCSVMKTAPLYKSLKIEGTNKQAKVLTFDGVRAEESTRRSNYNRIGKGVKHATVINARPILNWNTTEIFLYLFRYSLEINLAYRLGKSRVGCLICPYSTSWDDMIVNKCFHDDLEPFISRIEKWSKAGGIKDIDDYIKERKWKLRASGNFMNSKSSVSFPKGSTKFIAKVKNANHKFETWLPTIGEFTLSNNGDKSVGEIKYGGIVYPFRVKYSNSNKDYELALDGTNNVKLISLIKRILYKNTYCISCEACEVECPVGALTVYPRISIDKTKCVHCHKCLDAHDKGCIVANSISLTSESNMKAKSGIDRYNTFGLKEEWVEEYFISKDDFWNNNSLGTKQEPAVKNWLKDAEIIDNKNNITPLGELLSEIRQDMPELMWEIIWINLSYNSFITNWFIQNIRNEETYSKNSLVELIQEQFPNAYGSRTIANAVGSLLTMLKKSPIGENFRQHIAVDKNSAARKEYEDLSEISIAYSIYKYSQKHNTLSLRISDFYSEDSEGGVYKEFGVSKSCLESNLRVLNSSKNRILIAELNMGLDNISLRDDLAPIDVLKALI